MLSKVMLLCPTIMLAFSSVLHILALQCSQMFAIISPLVGKKTCRFHWLVTGMPPWCVSQWPKSKGILQHNHDYTWEILILIKGAASQGYVSMICAHSYKYNPLEVEKRLSNGSSMERKLCHLFFSHSCTFQKSEWVIFCTLQYTQ